MKYSIGLIVVIVILAFYTIRYIYKVTLSIRNQEIETKYGKNKIKTEQNEEAIDLTKERHERLRKSRTYSRRKPLEINDKKYLSAKRNAEKLKITSLIGWIIVLIIIGIYYFNLF